MKMIIQPSPPMLGGVYGISISSEGHIKGLLLLSRPTLRNFL